MDARCQYHPDRPAALACRRCGTFVCADCRSMRVLPHGLDLCERCWEPFNGERRVTWTRRFAAGAVSAAALAAVLLGAPLSFVDRWAAPWPLMLGAIAVVAIGASFGFAQRGTYRYPVMASVAVLVLPYGALVIAFARAAFPRPP